jgi:hypothetical protein
MKRPVEIDVEHHAAEIEQQRAGLARQGQNVSHFGSNSKVAASRSAQRRADKTDIGQPPIKRL